MANSSTSPDGNLERTEFIWLSAVAAFVILEALVGIQAFLAYQDQFFTVAQMKGRGIDHGLPFIWHFGMWGDLLFISGFAAYVIGRKYDRSRWHLILISTASGLVCAGFLSWLYTFSDISEAHIQSHRLTAVGWVHLLYMALGIAASIQFLLFCKNVSACSLRLISVLLLVHVFVGTHMALGILKLFFPLDWYPAQPLQSSLGWITICAVGFGLAWRNFGFRRITFQRSRTTEEYLRFLDYVCRGVSWPYFVARFGKALLWGEALSVLTLILVVGAVYQLSRLSVRQEFDIGKSIFPSDPARVPDRFKFEDRTAVTLSVVSFMTLYLALGWVAHCVLVASFCMLVIACIDVNTRRLINNNIREDFKTPKYAPDPNETDYSAIMKRRTVVSWYLFKLPHLFKEVARAVGCAAAFAIANYSYFTNARDVSFLSYVTDSLYCAVHGGSRLNPADNVAYIVLIGTLVANELVTWWWRRARDANLQTL